MSYGYVGDTSTSIKQQVKNAGVLSMDDVLDLEGKGQLGGSLELIAQQTFSGVQQIDFTNIPTDKYDVIVAHFQNVEHTDANKFTFAQFYESGTLEDQAVYQYAHQYFQADGTDGSLKHTGNNYIYLTWSNHGTTAGDTNGCYTYFYDLGNANRYSFASLQDAFWDNGMLKVSFGGGCLPQTSLVDGIRFGFNLASTNGTITLYGVKQL